MRFHTPPDQQYLIYLDPVARKRAVLVVTRGLSVLASYPAWLNNNRIPSRAQVAEDAAWRDASGKLLTK